MKKYTITNGEMNLEMQFPESEKVSCSDGYHTFDELYEHRCLLFINLCLMTPSQAFWRPHYEGWPLIGLILPTSEQITYHVPEKYLPLFKDKILEGGPDWDGHTSAIVVERLKQSAEILP